MPFDPDKHLQTYFTDSEHLRTMFKELAASPDLPKRLFVIHGVGGVGKSSLLRISRLYCKTCKIPIALVSLDETRSAVELLARTAKDLKVDGLRFPAFDKTFEKYREIQAKVDGQIKNAQDARNRMVDSVGKAASKTAEAAAGAIAGSVIGSVIPGIGTAIGGVLGSVLGSMGAEAFVDWLSGFLKKPEIDLLLDPDQKITADFLADMTRATKKQRVVLMIDTFDQTTALSDWLCDLALRLDYNVLLVIAGRAIPNWDRAWEGWVANARVEELKPMTEDNVRQLARRYYATIHSGDPDASQVEAIMRFARGLPMVVTSAVQLYVKYGVEDFQVVKPEIVASLVDRLMEGVPSELIPLLEAAAVVRWFDQPILRAVTGLADVREAYNELRRFPFMRTRSEGLALHNAVRDIMDENLHTQDSERYSQLHERAAVYFEKRLEDVTGEEAARLALERLYHRVCANEAAGMRLFQAMAEERFRYRLLTQLRALLSDAESYRLERETSRLWRKYYRGMLLVDKGQPYAEELEGIYQEILANGRQDSYLRARTLLDLAALLERDDRYIQPGVPVRITALLDECDRLLPEDDPDRFMLMIRKTVSHRKDRFETIYAALMKIIDYCLEHENYYALATTCSWVKGHCAMHGRWKAFLDIEQKVLDQPAVRANALLRSRALHAWQLARIWMGRYAEAEHLLRESIEIRHEGNEGQQDMNADLVYAVGIQGRLSEVTPLLEREAAKYRQFGQKGIYDLYWVLQILGFSHMAGGSSSAAKNYLTESVRIVRRIKDPYRVHEVIYFTGYCCLARGEWDEAEGYLTENLSFPFDDWHTYFKCGALVGLMRIRLVQGQTTEIASLQAQAEALAQQYEYNDHLSSLRIMEGMAADNLDRTIECFKQALIYALRYNRFLLDDVLSGRPQGTPVPPIIPYCLEHGEDGRRILTALRDGWRTGYNEVGAPRPGSISLLPEGIPLLAAEQIARENEPGCGVPQQSVLEQLEAALAGRK